MKVCMGDLVQIIDMVHDLNENFEILLSEGKGMCVSIFEWNF